MQDSATPTPDKVNFEDDSSSLSAHTSEVHNLCVPH